MTANPDQLPADGDRKRHKRNFEETHEILADAYTQFMTDRVNNPSVKQPTIAQLAKLTGISTRTVERHLAELDRDLNMARRTRKFRLMTDLALKGLVKGIAKGNVHAIRTWFESVESMQLGSMVKVELPSDTPVLNLKALSKEDLAAYKALIKKMTGGGRGTPQSAP